MSPRLLKTSAVWVASLLLLLCRDLKHTSARQMTLQRGGVHVVRQLIRAVDLAAHVTMSVAADLVPAVHAELVAQNFHL